MANQIIIYKMFVFFTPNIFLKVSSQHFTCSSLRTFLTSLSYYQLDPICNEKSPLKLMIGEFFLGILEKAPPAVKKNKKYVSLYKINTFFA